MGQDINMKYYIRIDGSGRKVPGSGVRRLKMPAYGRWVVEDANECCYTSTSTTTTTTTTTTVTP